MLQILNLTLSKICIFIDGFIHGIETKEKLIHITEDWLILISITLRTNSRKENKCFLIWNINHLQHVKLLLQNTVHAANHWKTAYSIIKKKARQRKEEKTLYIELWERSTTCVGIRIWTRSHEKSPNCIFIRGTQVLNFCSTVLGEACIFIKNKHQIRCGSLS